jgi:MFS family permease
MISGRTVLILGLTLLISWGTTYYLAGVFGERMAADLGWSLSTVHGGFTLALLVMAAVSALTGRAIDRYGGRWVMIAGAVLGAVGCAGLAVAETIVSHYASWIALGLAMRLTLYDAAFAALARIGGPDSGPAMSKITLLGGLASTVFWPFGHFLAEQIDWRAALFVYAGCLLLTIPLHLALPAGRWQADTDAAESPALALPDDDRARTAGRLYAIVFALGHFLSSAMAAHLVTLLVGLGIALGTAVSLGALRGIGQVAGRFWQVTAGGRIHPVSLTIGALSVVGLSFLGALFGGPSVPAAAAFVAFYGAGHGIVTITQGTLPLVLFDHRKYGARTGDLLIPSFIASALAPLYFALVIETFGVEAAIAMCAALALLAVAAALRMLAILRR